MRFTIDQNGDLPAPRQIHRQLIAEAERVAPKECCGLILGTEGRIESLLPTENVHSTPHTHFEIDPAALIAAHRAARAGGPSIIGYYHSHPAGKPHPSETDRASAAGDGRIWAIVAAGEVKLWRDTTQGFAPLSYIVISQ